MNLGSVPWATTCHTYLYTTAAAGRTATDSGTPTSDRPSTTPPRPPPCSPPPLGPCSYIDARAYGLQQHSPVPLWMARFLHPAHVYQHTPTSCLLHGHPDGLHCTAGLFDTSATSRFCLSWVAVHSLFLGLLLTVGPPPSPRTRRQFSAFMDIIPQRHCDAGRTLPFQQHSLPPTSGFPPVLQKRYRRTRRSLLPAVRVALVQTTASYNTSAVGKRHAFRLHMDGHTPRRLLSVGVLPRSILRSTTAFAGR